ncbi:Zn(II)2Cys6 transcription factor domain-containing protein [Aspergillus lucknowensis]|uniref:Zn(2)-C6 fungal-type domain-containing protein n=1 Tax=Aspergillus lucknowensis TaxID=176173 RepID=A0ABR4LYF2_9EURO
MTSRARGSPACENCRRRRIKCNQLRPRCSQCARAGISCSGYRTPIDLLFQDQTATVARKFRQENPGKQSKQAPASSQPPPHLASQPSLTLVAPSLQVEEVAWKYYFTNFNITRMGSVAIPSPWLSQSRCGMGSVTSVGLAALATTRHDPHMMALARQKYSAALRYLARAVLDPAELTRGPTTTASFNLSMFEMIISDGPDASYQWLRHIHGTAALIRVVKFPVDGAIFAITGCLQVCFTIAIGCLISESSVPPYVVDLVKSFKRAEIYVDVCPIIELFTLLSSLVNLYIQAKQSKENSPRDFTASLADIDDDLVSWTKRLPPVWTGDPSAGSPLHAGPNGIASKNWITRLWAYYRLCRVITHRIILDRIDQSPGKEDISLMVISRMSSEIYASVPTMLKKSFDAGSGASPLCLSSEVFFLITILQALLKVTDKQAVLDNWARPAIETVGEGFLPIELFVSRHLC